MRGTWLRHILLSTLCVTAIGCGDDDKDDGEDTLLSQQECNPLGGNGCVTPWPSNLYASEDATSNTGMRLDIPAGALPTNLDGIAIDPAPLNALDGFSAAAPMIVAFETGVDDSNLVPNSRFLDSVEDSSPTVLLDMETGERVLHFAEIDIRSPDITDKQALYIRSAKRLKPGTRYAAAVRKSLKAKDGSELPISAGFAALLSGKTTKHEALEARRDDYAEVLEALATAGVPTDDLVVAWDFTTASDEALREDLIVSRDRTLEAAGVDGANLTFEITDEDISKDSGMRRVDGTFTVPLMLSKGGDFAFGIAALRDADGLPKVEGMHDVPFTAVIPECALTATEPVPVIIYGHGLLGENNQAASGSQRALAEQMCAVVVGTIMRGMSTRDIPNVLLVLNDYNLADQIFDPMLQGINNHIALVQAVRGPMAETLFVNGEGASIVDTSKIHYYGLSQGHIFGATIAAYDPHIQRAALGVGGANYSLMLERSLDWPTYRNVVIGAYKDPLSVSIMINLLQIRWDQTEPTNVISDLPGNPIPGTPDKQFLLHMSRADSEVPNVSTEYQARTMGIPVLAPALYAPFGVPEMPGPLSSALVIFDGGFGDIPEGNIPPQENLGHYVTRNSQAAIEQIQIFFETGEIVHTCGDAQVCDCTTTACD